MKRILITALIAGAWANPSVAETFDWSGPYLGIQGGGRWVKIESDQAFVNGKTGTNDRIRNGTIGAFAGYNWQFGSVVTGLDTSFIANSSKSDERWDEDGRNVWHQEARFMGSLNGRLGYAIDKFLPYATAGYSYGKFKSELSSAYWNDTVYEDSTSRSGWNIGAGLDVAFTANVIGRAEYKFHDFGHKDLQGGFEEIYRQHTATLGVAYKF